MLSLKKNVPPKTPTLADIDPSIGELRSQLEGNGARLGGLQRELHELRPELAKMERAHVVVSPQLSSALGNFAVLAGSEARAPGPEPHARAREIDGEVSALNEAGDLLRHALRERSARASIALCERRRPDYEVVAAGILDGTAALWRSLAEHQDLLDGFVADGASAAALDVLPTHPVREALDALLRQCRQRGQRLPANLPGFRT